MDDRFDKAALLMTDLVGDVYPDESHLELKSKCRHALNIALGEVKLHFASVVKARNNGKCLIDRLGCSDCELRPYCRPRSITDCFFSQKG